MDRGPVIEFILNMTSKNYWGWFHWVVAGLFSWIFKHPFIDPVAVFRFVVVCAIGYEVWQYAKMHRNWKGWSWTTYGTRFKWLGDMSGDIVGALLASYWILF